MPVKIDRKARFRKEFQALSEEDQETIIAEINRFQAGERVDLVRIRGDLWRLKTGVWRVFMTFSKGIAELLFIERRTTTTYKKRR